MRPISVQLPEHSNINFRANSSPLSAKIANKVQYVRGVWRFLVCGHVCAGIKYCGVVLCVTAFNMCLFACTAC